MIEVVKKEIDVEEWLRKRLVIICDFYNTSSMIINNSIREIDKTNISYIEPYRVIIKDDTFGDMKETYIFSKEHDNGQKDNDDYDLEKYNTKI